MDIMTQRYAYARKKMEEASPSRRHGIDAAMEEQLRRSYTLFMQRLGRTLRLPQHPTIATATILCHRFFFRQSHAKNDSLLIATACLFLASKSEDTPRRLAHIAGASYNLRFGTTRTTPGDPFVLENRCLQKESERLILLAEHLVLCTLEFELEVELPYKCLFDILKMLKENPGMQKELFKFGECCRKSQREGKSQMANLGQVFDINMDRHVGAPANPEDAQNNVSGKLSQPVLIDNSGFNHAGAHHGSGNGTYRKSRISPDYVSYTQVNRHANDYVYTQSFREAETSFHQVAWNFVNDTLLTLMCMQFKPHQIAAGSVWLAAKFLGIKLPSEGERAWWKAVNVTPLELEEVGHQFIDVYPAEEEANPRKGTNHQSVSKPHNLSR